MALRSHCPRRFSITAGQQDISGSVEIGVGDGAWCGAVVHRDEAGRRPGEAVRGRHRDANTGGALSAGHFSRVLLVDRMTDRTSSLRVKLFQPALCNFGPSTLYGTMNTRPSLVHGVDGMARKRSKTGVRSWDHRIDVPSPSSILSILTTSTYCRVMVAGRPPAHWQLVKSLRHGAATRTIT